MQVILGTQNLEFTKKFFGAAHGAEHLNILHGLKIND
jgi:hypothetical protein